MMEIGMIILFFSLSLAAMIISIAFAHRILTETKIKARAFERSYSDDLDTGVKVDEMSQRLNEFRNQRFGRQLVNPEQLRSSISSRTKAKPNKE
jgi:hypothetical protein